MKELEEAYKLSVQLKRYSTMLEKEKDDNSIKSLGLKCKITNLKTAINELLPLIKID